MLVPIALCPYSSNTVCRCATAIGSRRPIQPRIVGRTQVKYQRPRSRGILQDLLYVLHTMHSVDFVTEVGLLQIFFGVVAVYVLYKYWTRDPRLAHLPPHVRGWPIINQTFQQMEDNVIPRLQGWAKEYGEIFTTTAGNTTFIWLDSRKAVKELYDRRSGIYSSRHPHPMVERASGGKRMVFMPYGQDWRALRSIVHRVRIAL